MINDENIKIEYKRELTDDVKKEIIAFLNTVGGTIYVGVNNDKTIYKPFLEEKRDIIELTISNWITNAIYPSTYGLIKHYFDSKGVLVIKVYEGNHKPYYLKDKGPKPSGVYKRVGSSKRMASDEDILEMLLESRNYSYETDTSKEQLLTFEYTEKVFKEKNIKFTKRDKVSLGLINNEGKYTNLAYLLSDQSRLTVKLAEYDKNYNFKLKKEISGSLIKIFNEVEEQVDRLNDVSAIIDGSSFARKEMKSYPDKALREIILNAFCHANYRINSNIKIEFFPDEIKITSPGCIFNATLIEVLNGVQTYRNPRLINVLNKIKLIENYGTGIPRTINAYKMHFLKPTFLELDNFFIVKLPNLRFHKFAQKNKINSKDDEIKNRNDEINFRNDEINFQNDNIDIQNDEINIRNDEINSQNDEINFQNDKINSRNDEINIQNDEIKFIPFTSISSNAKKVLFEIKRNIFITRKEIALLINKSEATVDRAIKELKTKNYIKEKDSNKKGAWIILKID